MHRNLHSVGVKSVEMRASGTMKLHSPSGAAAETSAEAVVKGAVRQRRACSHSGTTTRYLQPASPSALDCPSSTRLHLLLTPSLTHVPFVRLCNPFPSCSRAPPSISRLCPRSAQRNRPPQQLSPPWPPRELHTARLGPTTTEGVINWAKEHRSEAD